MAHRKHFKTSPKIITSPLFLSGLLITAPILGAALPPKPATAPSKAAKPTLTPKQQAILAYNEGNRLVQSGKAQAAIPKYLEALRLDPTFLDAYNNLGVLYVRGKQWAMAEEVYKRIALLRPNEVRPLLALAQLQRESGQPGASRDTLRRAVDRFPGDLTARLALAQSYEAENLIPQAEEQLTVAAVSNPKSLAALKPLAGFYLRHQRTDDLYRTMQRMWPLDPRNADLALDLGIQAHQRKDWPKAVSYYRAAVRLNPKLQTAWRNLGSVYSTLKRPKEASEAFARASKLSPKDFKSQAALGVSRYDAGDLAGAEAAFRSAAKLQPNNAEIQGYLALALLRQKKYKEAEPIYARLRSHGATDPDSLNNLAYIYSVTGRPRQALPLYEKAAAARPDDPNPHRSLASLYWQTGQTDKAAKELETLARLAPDDAEVRDALGAAYRQLGQKDKAVALMEEQASKDPKGYGPLADYYRSEGQPAKETEALEAWLKADPKNSQAADRLASAYLRQKKPEDALRTLQNGLAASPGDATLYGALYRYYLNQGDKKTAAEKLREGLAKIPADSPEAAGLHTDLARLLQETDTDGALKELGLAEAAAKDPQTKLGIGLRRADLLEKRQAGAGDKAYQQLLTRYPDDFQLRFRWALRLANKKNYLEALRQLKAGFLRDPKAVSGNPFLPFGPFKDWSVAAGQPQLGISTLKELLQRYPKQSSLIVPVLATALAAEADRQNRPFSVKDPDLAYLAALEKKYPALSSPQDPTARYLYERARDRASQKKTADAVAIYGELVRAAPKVPYYRSQLGKLLEEAGKKEEALAVYRQAQKVSPDYPEFTASIKRLTEPDTASPSPPPANPIPKEGTAPAAPTAPTPAAPKVEPGD